MVVTATNTICKQVAVEELSEYFQAFSISVLHFCGLKSSHRVSCIVFHLFEVFVLKYGKYWYLCLLFLCVKFISTF